MKLKVFVSKDGRCKTAIKPHSGSFTLLEPTDAGLLVTEFSKNGSVLDQLYSKTQAGAQEVAKLMYGNTTTDFVMVPTYEKVKVNAKCTACGAKKIGRELDYVSPKIMHTVPVLPVYVCMSCSKKFYSLHNDYLKNLVERNSSMFSKAELEEKKKDKGKFMKELEDYIIRIFASKGLSRIEIG